MPGLSSTETTRRAPEMERYTEIKPVAVEGYPDAHAVWLKVTNQSFCINDYSETKEDAEWMRDMLCVALAKIRQDAIASTPNG